jgi:cytochrome P450
MQSATAMPAAPARRLSDLPSVPGLPWIGNLHQLDTQRLHLVLEGWQRQLGPLFTLHLGRQPVLVISDSEIAQSLLRERPQRYRRVRVLESVIGELLGAPGVFAAEGDAWEPQRRLVMQSLAPTRLRGYFPAVQAITQRLHRRWAQAAAEGRVFDIRDDLMRYTVDVTTRLAFGEDPNTLDDGGDVIQQHLARIFPMLMARINTPLPYWRWFKLPRDRALDRSLAAVKQHIAGLIARTRERMRAAPEAPPANLLEALLAERDAPGSRFTDADVTANVMTILLGGEDTTAISLAWSMPYLAADPALQQRLHEQARAVLGDATVCPDHESVRGLDAFEAVVNESLRFRPTAPAIFIEPNEDVQIAGIAIRRGTPLWLLLRPDMLDDRHFGDALSFRPERWHHGNKPEGGCPLAHNTRAHLQFGAGPRVCPGRHLALVEMRLVLSMLMCSFRVELACRPDELRETLAFTMMPERMPVRLHRRQPP